MTGLSDTVAVVLAGGFGTRVRHLLPGVPKPMAAVAGRPFLEWVLRYLRRQGLESVVLSTGHLAEVVARHFEARRVDGLRVQCVAETTPLGTGGGFLHAARASGERPSTWLVLNGDSLAFADLPALFAPLGDPAVQGVLLGRTVPDASRYGTLSVTSAGELRGFEEKRTGQGIINAGVYGLRASLVDGLPAGQPLSLEKDVFPAWVARSVPLRVRVTEAPFLDIGTPETLEQAEKFVRENAAEFGPVPTPV